MAINELVLGVDAGTHGVRIAAVDAALCVIVAQSEGAYTRKTGDGIAELAGGEMERALFEALDGLSLPEGARVSALGITHQRGTVMPVDADGRPLTPAFCDSDGRAADQKDFERLGLDPRAYYETSGCPVVSFNGLSKILWIRENLPAVFENAAAWLSPQDYLLRVLGAGKCISEGSAMRNGLLDIRRRELSGTTLRRAGIAEWEIVRVGETAGVVSERFAERYPFLRGARLVAVPGDQPAAFVGSGAAAAGGPMASALRSAGTGGPGRAAAASSIGLNLGTTFVASGRSDRPYADPAGLVTTEVLPFSGYSPEFGTGAGGQFMDFLMKLLYGERWTEAFDAAEAAARESGPGARGLVIVPLLWQATSVGVEGTITGLRPVHARGDLVRAAYEGLACEARLSVAKVEAACSAGTDGALTAGPSARPLRVFGGMARLETFLQILADVTGRRVEVPASEQASALGAAVTCILGLSGGDVTSLPERIRKPAAIYRPDEESVAFYERQFESYCARRLPVPSKLS